jgi:hypothetical protein
MVLFSSIFRFRDEKGNIYFGEAGESSNHTLESLTGRSVPIFRGEHPWDDDFVLTEEQRTVAEVWIYGWAPGLVTEASGDRFFVHYRARQYSCASASITSSMPTRQMYVACLCPASGRVYTDRPNR